MNEESIFATALACTTPEERASYLDQACGDDADLRHKLEGLLEARANLGDFLVQPAVERKVNGDHAEGETQSYHPQEKAGQQIGPYKLLEKLGEGGMGTVWVAGREEPIKQRVALKLIKPGMDSAQILRRFDAERQALALMSHHNIAKMLDVGATAAGRPYFVMELVKGVPITKYCDETHATLQERLKLFIPVCLAVQHAHQKGIIHRDIKPSNVLVCMEDSKPVPKVIDFGVAKALHQPLTAGTLFTGFNQILGTLEYMSPEQAELNALDIDTRADIYALGVLLFELLTGSTPLTRAELRHNALLGVLRKIKETEPTRPSTRLSESKDSLASLAALRRTDPAKLMKEVRGDLDWIVLKCLEPDRNRRYETANAVAREIERHLDQEPVEACPPSRTYRLRKFVRRNKPLVIAATLIFVTLILGIIGTSIGFYLEAQRAEGERQARLDVDHQRQEAERNLAFAKKGNQILGSVFAGLDPEKIAESGRPLQDVLKDNLKTAIKELEGSAIGDPLTVAEMQDTLGLSLLALGEYDQAIEVLIKARDTFLNKLGPDHSQTLDSMNNLAEGFKAAEKLDLALPLLEETLKLIKAKLGPDHPDTLTSINNLAAGYQAARKPDLALPLFEETLKLAKAKLGPEHPQTLSFMNNLALAYRAAGNRDLALPLLEESFKLMKAKLGPYHPRTLKSAGNLARGYEDAGKLDLALPLYEETLKLRKAKLGPDHPDTLHNMGNLAAAYWSAKQLDKSIPLFEETLKRQEAKFGRDHPSTFHTAANLGVNYKDVGRLKEAIPLLEEALKLQNAKLGPEHPQTLSSMNNLASAYQAAGKLALALPLFEETLNLRKAKLGPEHPDTLISMGNLATAYREAGKLALALPLLEETLNLIKAKLGPEHPHTLTSMNNLAVAYQEAGKRDVALPLKEETLKLRKAKLGPEHPDTLDSMNNLAVAYREAGKLDLAVPLFEETLKLMKTKLGPEHPSTLGSMNNLAQAYREAGKLDLALPLHEETLKLRKAKLGPEHPETLNSMNNLATVYWSAKQLDKSIPLFEETLKRQEAKLGRDHPKTLLTVSNLGVNYKDAGRLKEAIPLLEEAYRAAKKYPVHRAAGPLLLDAYAQAGENAKLANLLQEQLAEARKTPPKDSPQLAQQLATFGLSLLQARAFADAEPLLRECLAIREKTQPDVWTTFNTISMLGGALLGQKKYAEAEPLLLKGYEGMKAREKTIPPQGQPRVSDAIRRLVQLYEETGKQDQADQWRKKLPATSPDKPEEKKKD